MLHVADIWRRILFFQCAIYIFLLFCFSIVNDVIKCRLYITYMWLELNMLKIFNKRLKCKCKTGYRFLSQRYKQNNYLVFQSTCIRIFFLVSLVISYVISCSTSQQDCSFSCLRSYKFLVLQILHTNLSTGVVSKSIFARVTAQLGASGADIQTVVTFGICYQIVY